jgi:hypothetical protein
MDMRIKPLIYRYFYKPADPSAASFSFGGTRGAPISYC